MRQPLKFTYLLITILLCCEVNAQEQKDTLNLFDIDLMDLPNIQVTTGSRTQKSLKLAPSIMSVVTKQNIEARGVTSLIDILKYIPGIEWSYYI